MDYDLYNDIYRYPRYRPIYRLNNNKRKKFNAVFPFLTNNSNREKIRLQVFYNTLYDDSDGIPLGSTYKYIIPNSIDKKPESSYSSISEKQKRRSLKSKEFFGNLENKKSDINNYYYLFLFIFIFIFFIFIKTTMKDRTN